MLFTDLCFNKLKKNLNYSPFLLLLFKYNLNFFYSNIFFIFNKSLPKKWVFFIVKHPKFNLFFKKYIYILDCLILDKTKKKIKKNLCYSPFLYLIYKTKINLFNRNFFSL